MAISINWATKVITIPKADTDLVSAGPPEVRRYDIGDTFRAALLAEEDNEIGITYQKTHRHFTEIALAGITYSRLVELINGYTVEFEDGQYTVELVGANHNIADVRVNNQVSLITNNSAGLQVLSGTGLSPGESQILSELALIHGLIDGSPATITPTSRAAGSVSQTVTGDETSTTITRDP